MLRSQLTRYLIPLVIPAIFVLAGATLIIPRSDTAPERVGALRGDTLEYVKMIDGRYTDAMSPYRYRVLVPTIARLLPWPAARSMKIITYVSLYMSYLLGWLILRKMAFPTWASLTGLAAVFLMPIHLYNYSNPYLTDGFGLMVLFLITWCLLHGRFAPFVSAVVVGVLAREAALFLAPAWLAKKQYLKGCAAIAAGASVFLALRYFLHDPESGLWQWDAGTPLVVAKSWYTVWIMGGVGLLVIPRRWFALSGRCFALLLAGALLSATFASDTARMFSIMTPVMLILAASFFARLQKVSAHLPALILISLVLGDILLVANVLLYDEGQAWGIDRRLFATAVKAVELALCLAAVFALRREIASRFARKLSILSGASGQHARQMG